MNVALSTSVGAALGLDVVVATRLGGGDVAESFRIELEGGRIVFAKTHASPPPGFFTTEADGLSWLRHAGAISVPRVLAVADGSATGPPYLVLEWIDEDRHRSVDTDETAFGRGLATVHRAGAACFGRSDRATTGSRALPNEPCDTWAEFYGTQRLHPLADLARASAALPDDAIAELRWVADHLDDLNVPSEPPARLHGDLWAGNRVVDRVGTSWLIDPAAHGGHREFDLAMMRLFGGFGEECFEAYAEEHPLSERWNERVPLHQLAPLTVHAIKFGGGYVDATVSALRHVRSNLR